MIAPKINFGTLWTLGVCGVVLAQQSAIVVFGTPAASSAIRDLRASVDLDAQNAVLAQITSEIAQVNPAEKDSKAKLLLVERGIDSNYVAMNHQTNELLQNTHLVLGELYAPGPLRAWTDPYVFGYQLRIENEGLVNGSIVTYEGNIAHNSNWVEKAKP